MVVSLQVIKFSMLAVLGGILVGCGSTGQSGNKPDIRKQAQECVRKAGVTSEYTMQYVFKDGRERYRVPAKKGVTPEQSRMINACISKGNAEAASASTGTVATSAKAPAALAGNHSYASGTAQTAMQACRAEYHNELRKNRRNTIAVSGGGLSIGQSLLISVAASALGQGAGKSALQFRYKRCMTRAGATPAQIAVEVPASSRARSGRRSRAVMSGGAGYRISGAPVRATTRVAPTTTRTVARRGKSRNGKLALPTQYPLMQGDAALWSTLTLEQQKRAILFLQSGSSIQSSLLGD